MLIESLRHSVRVEPSIRGLLIGDGPDFKKIEALVKQQGLSEIVFMTGHREDAADLIACLDLFVLSSFSEGTSMALLEAMAGGVAVAVTDVGGNPEVVIKDQTGWVVPSGSVDDLTAAILDAVGKPSKRRAFADAGKRRFEERFTFEKMIENYRKLYENMLADRGR